MENPFEPLHNEIAELKGLVTQLLRKPKEDLSNRLYTLNEAADILKVDRQTVKNHIDRGNIKATKISNRFRIAHNELFNSLDEVKSIKYRR